MSVNKPTATKTQAEIASFRKEVERLRAMLIPIQADQAETGRRIRAMIQEIDEAQ
jgi:septal ring factor EnvC (AmiA/AmiB activator)